MVGTAQAIIFRYAIDHRDPAVRASIANEAKAAPFVPIENQRLAQDFDELGRMLLHLGEPGYGVPVSTQQFAHGSAGSHLRQELIFFIAEHGSFPF
jgi:hypothetical protein